MKTRRLPMRSEKGPMRKVARVAAMAEAATMVAMVVGLSVIVS